MAPLQTPTGEERQTESPQEQDPRGDGTRVALAGRHARYRDLDTHELITLLDEVDDERSRARFREAVYISVIVWLVLGWVMIYGPRYLWHAPHIVTALPDDKRNTMTYLDTPPDLQKQLKRTRPTPNISERSTESQSPKPSPQAPQPRAGTPAPPAAKPTPTPRQAAPTPQPPAPQPAPQPQAPPPQQARNTPPTPVPPHPAPAQPLADAPTPNATPNRNIFNSPSSAAQAIQQATRNGRSGGGESGDYGSVGRGQQGGTKQGVQILSDTQGVDFGKYLARLLSDVRRNWLPLIPEECRPPLNKQGITGVRFTIQPDGKISAMHLDYSTHDVAIDRAAWGSITSLGQAQPLPKEFHGPNLELRIEYRINKDAPEAQ